MKKITKDELIKRFAELDGKEARNISESEPPKKRSTWETLKRFVNSHYNLGAARKLK